MLRVRGRCPLCGGVMIVDYMLRCRVCYRCRYRMSLYKMVQEWAS